MFAIIKKIGVVIGALAAIGTTACNKNSQINESTDKDTVQSENQTQKAEVPANTESSEPLPSNEENGIMAIYGMPDDLDESEVQPVADAPEDLPKLDEGHAIMPLYGIPTN